jgi:hypothetical protein
MPKVRRKLIFKGNTYRSGFEMDLAQQLDAEGVEFEYETEQFAYYVKITSGKCNDCGSKNVVQYRKYKPDFHLGDVIVEAKGRFLPADQKKMLAFKEQYPDKDIRMLFYRDSPLTRKRRKLCSEWCEEHGFECAVGTFPKKWLQEAKRKQNKRNK